MVKKFTIACSFNGAAAETDFYVGSPMASKHPIEFQAKWLADNKGGSVPSDVMDAIAKIRDIADNNNASFEDLCFYAISVANGKIDEEVPEFNRLLAMLD
ncbi:hypothetical protein FACS1894152_1400 [Bacilli bacterium]|nr:hypothetical protein FACS1894152_1400 [Bacilli bacterium]